MFLLFQTDASNMNRRSAFALLVDDRAQGLSEYALIIAFVAIAVIVAVRFLGGKVNNSLNNSESQLS